MALTSRSRSASDPVAWHRGTNFLLLATLLVACNQHPKQANIKPFQPVRSNSPGETTSQTEAETGGAPTAPESIPPFRFSECSPPVQLYVPPEALEVRMLLPKTVFGRTEPVPLSLEVRNTGTRPIVRSWPRDKQDRDYWVRNASGTIWRWAYGEDSFRGGGGSETYQPGEARSLQPDKWDSEFCLDGKQFETERVPGKYGVAGYVIDGDHAWASEQVDFEVR